VRAEGDRKKLELGRRRPCATARARMDVQIASGGKPAMRETAAGCHGGSDTGAPQARERRCGKKLTGLVTRHPDRVTDGPTRAR